MYKGNCTMCSGMKYLGGIISSLDQVSNFCLVPMDFRQTAAGLVYMISTFSVQLMRMIITFETFLVASING